MQLQSPELSTTTHHHSMPPSLLADFRSMEKEGMSSNTQLLGFKATWKQGWALLLNPSFALLMNSVGGGEKEVGGQIVASLKPRLQSPVKARTLERA